MDNGFRSCRQVRAAGNRCVQDQGMIKSIENVDWVHDSSIDRSTCSILSYNEETPATMHPSKFVELLPHYEHGTTSVTQSTRKPQTQLQLDQQRLKLIQQDPKKLQINEPCHNTQPFLL